MKTYQTLSIEHNKHKQVATIWMDRPEVFNAFDEQLIIELQTAFQQLDQDPAVRVVVLAGRGQHFSAGADLNWMRRAANSSMEQNRLDAEVFANMLLTIAQMTKPTIARIQGAALGGGTGLAAACDMAIVADNAQFATSEVKFGIIPAVISPYMIRAIGLRHALRYFQTGERFDAGRAYEMGLATQVVALAELDNAVNTMVEMLLLGGPKAQQAAKELISAVSHLPIGAESVKETARRISKQRAQAEARDGIAAFLEKRPPLWINQ